MSAGVSQISVWELHSYTRTQSAEMQYNPSEIAEKSIRVRCFVFWGSLEAGIYTALAFALALTAIVALAGTGRVLWEGLRKWQSSDTILRTIDRMLLVLMLVEILHTVRISIRSHVLVTEPFLIVGLIATIRRIFSDHARDGKSDPSRNLD
jgi:Phosphate-starvation-inducible E family